MAQAFDVIVMGSGFGGAVTAGIRTARSARRITFKNVYQSARTTAGHLRAPGVEMILAERIAAMIAAEGR